MFSAGANHPHASTESANKPTTSSSVTVSQVGMEWFVTSKWFPALMPHCGSVSPLTNSVTMEHARISGRSIAVPARKGSREATVKRRSMNARAWCHVRTEPPASTSLDPTSVSVHLGSKAQTASWTSMTVLQIIHVKMVGLLSVFGSLSLSLE